jgi:hypothetical protein
MTPGDPFRTKQLDELRSSHRRLLVALEHAEVGMDDADELPNPEPDAAIESAIRAEVQSLVESNGPMFEAYADYHQGALLLNAVRKVGSYAIDGVRDRARAALPSLRGAAYAVNESDGWPVVRQVAVLLRLAERYSKDVDQAVSP